MRRARNWIVSAPAGAIGRCRRWGRMTGRCMRRIADDIGLVLRSDLGSYTLHPSFFALKSADHSNQSVDPQRVFIHAGNLLEVLTTSLNK